MTLNAVSRNDGISMRTVCSSICGALIFIVAIIPPTILIIERFMH